MFNPSLTLEAERQYYLESAGIRLWYARAPLPGAAASADFDFAEPDASETLQEQQPAPTAGVAPSSPKAHGRRVSSETARARLQGLMSATQGKPVVPESDAKTPVVDDPVVDEKLDQGHKNGAVEPEPAQPEGSIESRLKVHWGIWLAGRHVLISERSPDASAALQDELAQNILKALGDQVESTLVAQWPVFNNAQVPGTDNAGLKTLLQEITEGFGNRPVIALGLWSEGQSIQRHAWLDELFGELAVDSPYSVAALAAQASNKRELWLQLKSWQRRVG